MRRVVLVLLILSLLAVAYAMPNRDSQMGKGKDKKQGGGKTDRQGGKHGQKHEGGAGNDKGTGKSNQSPNICKGIKTCLPCVKNTLCAFDPTTSACKPRNQNNPEWIVHPTNCQLNEASSSETIKKKVDDAWKKMRNHIFKGEPGGDHTSGRHKFTAWREKNDDAGRCDTETHICAFRLNGKQPKTVWDDRDGTYTEADIEAMCKTAITLNFSATGQAKKDGTFVVQSKHKMGICVRHQVAGQGSCFPVGIHRSGLKMGNPCGDRSGDTAAIPGKTEEILAV